MSVIIDDTTYDIPVISLRRKADFLDKYAERTIDGKLHRELIGVYFNYQLKLGASTNTEEYAALWSKLTEVTEYHTVTVPDETDTPYTYTAYFSNVGDELRKQNSANYWQGLTVNFIAKDPAS